MRRRSGRDGEGGGRNIGYRPHVQSWRQRNTSICMRAHHHHIAHIPQLAKFAEPRKYPMREGGRESMRDVHAQKRGFFSAEKLARAVGSCCSSHQPKRSTFLSVGMSFKYSRFNSVSVTHRGVARNALGQRERGGEGNRLIGCIACCPPVCVGLTHATGSLSGFGVVRFYIRTYRDRLKCLYVVARSLFQLLLTFSAWLCLGPA